MATQINLNIDGNFLLVEDTSTGNITNHPLSFTSYQIFTPQNIDADSPDNKTYLFFTLLDGSTRKSGGYDIFCEGANYTIASVQLDRFFTSIQDLTQYLDNVVATPTDVYENPSTSNSYKVFTALLTQSGASDSNGIGSGDLTIGTTYFIDDYETQPDFSNVGAQSNSIGTYFIATGTTPNSWGNGTLLTYNTGAPIATILKNNIGNIWITYSAVGNYSINSNGLFPVGKSWTPTIQIFNDTAGLRDGEICEMRLGNSNEYYIATFDQTGQGVDTKLDNTPIEIRVYN